MLLLFENGVTGYLAMPIAGETQECNDRNAAGTMFWTVYSNWLVKINAS